MKVRLGISTCPNDTFAFHGLLTGAVTCEGLDLQIELADVQKLNEMMSAREFDVAKVSFAAALRHADRWWVLPSGSALGFGVGPVVLAPPPHLAVDPRHPILAPGPDTTATLLFQMFHPDQQPVEHRVFSEIIPALERGEARLGVCIHEGRFTYRERGLTLAEDLGATWEHETGSPLPLGGLVAHRDLPASAIDAVSDAIARSIDYAQENRSECESTMQQHAQELTPDAIWKHVDLYVSDATRALGPTGAAALAQLSERAARIRKLPGELRIWGDSG